MIARWSWTHTPEEEDYNPTGWVEVVHACPPDGTGLTPCCGKTPFELLRSDRMTLDPTLVTCKPEEEGER